MRTARTHARRTTAIALTVASLALPAGAAGATVDARPAVTVGDGSVSLAWDHLVADEVQVLRDGEVVATSTGRSFVDTVRNGEPATYALVADGVEVEGSRVRAAGVDVAVDDVPVVTRVTRRWDGGARVLVDLPDHGHDVATVAVAHDGRVLTTAVPTTVHQHATLDVFGLPAGATGLLEVLLLDTAGNATVATHAHGGPALAVDVSRLVGEPTLPTAVAVQHCDERTTLGWDVLGSATVAWEVEHTDGTVQRLDEPSLAVARAAERVRLRGIGTDERRSAWTPWIAVVHAPVAKDGLCTAAPLEPTRHDRVAVDTDLAGDQTFAALDTAGVVVRVDLGDAVHVAAVEVTTGPGSEAIVVGPGDSRLVSVPLDDQRLAAEQLTVTVVGVDGSRRSVTAPVPDAAGGVHQTVGPVRTAPGRVTDVTVLDGHGVAHVDDVSTAPRRVLRDGEQVAVLPAGATSVAVGSVAPDTAHAWQLAADDALGLRGVATTLVR